MFSRVVLILVTLVSFLPLTGWSMDIHYFLHVQIDLQNQLLTGMARLYANDNLNLTLTLKNLSNIQVNDQDITVVDNNLVLPIQRGKEVIITYQAILNDKSLHFVNSENVFLTGNWYPQPDKLVEYTLSVTLPKDFLANSVAETLTVKTTEKYSTFTFEFPYPLDTLSLAASKNYVFKTANYKDVVIETYFFKADANLADTYIEYTKKYLARYEEQLAPYPYRRFAIVENVLPTGYSMPTYTLLGQSVIRLPFIVNTSLGHEILHQWFGNSIFVDYPKGNWAEGITHYLADHAYAAAEGNGVAYRQQILLDYQAYVNDQNVRAVRDFHTVSDKTSQAIGYGKAAMIFHMLKQKYGEKLFFTVLQDFIKSYSFRQASWEQIQAIFEKYTGDYLDRYFGQWLDRQNIPHLTVESSQLVVSQGQFTLTFTVLQPTPPFQLHLPITLYLSSGKKKQQFIEISKAKEKITLTLDELPIRVILDEDYDVMRQLLPAEISPTLAAVMGKPQMLVVAAEKQRSLYQPLIEAITFNSVNWTTPQALQFNQLRRNSLIIAGFDTPPLEQLFGKQSLPQDGVRVTVQQHPYNDKEVIVQLHAKDDNEVKSVQRKLSHYGHYSTLAFTAGINTEKNLTASVAGIPILQHSPSRVLEPNQITDLKDIIPKIVTSRVIYVGEQHEKFSHHINQLMIITQLHEAGYPLAVGMEMFPLSSQAILDEYLANQIDERTFLKESRYFSQWRVDYQLYKPIIDYIKQAGIPLVALNIEPAITHQVVKEGIHSLTAEEQQHLPSAMDFTNKQYRQDLYQIFLIHQQQFGHQNFDYFLQSQLLWDETMAQSAHQYLLAHPKTKLIVLAGNGHLMYRYGIPQRLHRRNGEPFSVIIQDEKITKGIADYILLTEDIQGKLSPRLGIWLEDKNNQVIIKSVGKETLAHQVGLQVGDIITQFAGQKIQSAADLKLALFYTQPNSTITIQTLKKGKKLTQELTLPEEAHFH
jgi:uncharacterized iron-regulated protein